MKSPEDPCSAGVPPAVARASCPRHLSTPGGESAETSGVLLPRPGRSAQQEATNLLNRERLSLDFRKLEYFRRFRLFLAVARRTRSIQSANKSRKNAPQGFRVLPQYPRQTLPVDGEFANDLCPSYVELGPVRPLSARALPRMRACERIVETSRSHPVHYQLLYVRRATGCVHSRL